MSSRFRKRGSGAAGQRGSLLRARSFLALTAPIIATVALAALLPRRPAATLRVCADPNNLPFSNQRGEGLENRIAQLIARELNTSVSYVWWAQRRGFIRNTLAAGNAIVVMGVPRDFRAVLTTRPVLPLALCIRQPSRPQHRGAFLR